MNSKHKQLGMGGVALACALAFAGPVSAQNFSGFYAGGSAGYAWGKADTRIDPIGPIPQPVEPSPLEPRPRGGLLGVQVGYSVQSGSLVFGAEADISLSGLKGKDQTSNFTVAGTPVPPGSKISSKQETDWLATLRARLGYAAGSDLLIYGTGGPAWGRVKNKANAEFPGISYPGSESSTRMGWAVGAGMEYAMSRTTSIKFEALHYDLGDSSDRGGSVPAGSPFVTKYSWEARGNLLRGGVNFRF